MTAQKLDPAILTDSAVIKSDLPDLFSRPDSSRVRIKEEWSEQSNIWRSLILDIEYGGLPPKPDLVTFETLCHSNIGHWPDSPRILSYRINCQIDGRTLSFCVRILIPDKPGLFPAIVNGDGCWWTISDTVAQKVLNTGCALVMFNRTEIVEDLGYNEAPDKKKRQGGLYDLYPEHLFGALSAWAWGYHRCIDLLYELPFIDSNRIAVSGHSRGGKTVLIAGMTDPRITLVNDNASGAGGSATFRYIGEWAENLEIINYFPSWFGNGLQPYLNREEDMPFDQHCLLATIAPRPLLSTYALNDRWSNPEGMIQSSWAAKEVYRFLGDENNIAFHLREGDHTHSPEDWNVLLDFIGWKWFGKKPEAAYNSHPYRNMKPTFSWKTPKS